MSEKYITINNKILYYLVAPCLLLYFVLIDIGVIECTITGLSIFSIAIILGVVINMLYKKKNSNYKFEINSYYGKVMMILVFFELAFNMSKL